MVKNIWSRRKLQDHCLCRCRTVLVFAYSIAKVPGVLYVIFLSFHTFCDSFTSGCPRCLNFPFSQNLHQRTDRRLPMRILDDYYRQFISTRFLSSTVQSSNCKKPTIWTLRFSGDLSFVLLQKNAGAGERRTDLNRASDRQDKRHQHGDHLAKSLKHDVFDFTILSWLNSSWYVIRLPASVNSLVYATARLASTACSKSSLLGDALPNEAAFCA